MEGSSSQPKGKRTKHAVVSRAKRGGGRSRQQPREEPPAPQEPTLDAPPSDYSQVNFLRGSRLVPSQIQESVALDLYKFQDWMGFLRYSNECRKLEVALFYKRMKFEDGNLTSRVHGVEITITPELLSRLFNIPNDGLAFWFDPTQWPENENEEHCIQALLKDGPNETDDLSIMPTRHMLGPDTQILCAFAHNTLLPRDRKDGMIDKMLGFFMWKVLSRVRLNLPFYMIHHMVHSRRISTHSIGLPYAMHLTAIFDHFNVPYKQDEVSKFNHNTDLTLRQLKQMKIYLHENRFIHENEFLTYGSQSRAKIEAYMEAYSDVRRRFEEEDEDVVERRQERAQIPRGRAMTNYELFEAMSLKFDGLDTRLTELKTEVSGMSSYLQTYGYRPAGNEGTSGSAPSGHTTMEE